MKFLSFAFVLGMSTYASAHGEKEIFIGDILNKEITIDKILETATHSNETQYQQEDEYIVEAIRSELQHSDTKNIEELSKGTTIADFIGNASAQREEYIATHPDENAPQLPQSFDLATLVDPGSPLQPASPLTTILGDGHSLANTVNQATAPLPSISVVVDKGNISLSVKEVRIAVGDKLPFIIQQTGKTNSSLSVFTRDSSLLNWDKGQKLLSALKEGSTEIYLHYEDQLLLLPVHVGKAAVNSLNPLTELTVLNNLEQSKGLIASIDTRLDKNVSSQDQSQKSGLANRNVNKRRSTVSEVSKDSYAFTLNAMPYESQKVQFRIVDERSSDEAQKVFAVAGAMVHIIGSEMTKKTDSLGIASDFEIPARSSVMVEVKGPYHHPSVVEVPAWRLESGEPIEIRIMQETTFAAYSQIASSQYNENLSSICASAQSLDGKPLEGVSVSLHNWAKSRPYYFNRYGYLDPQADRTGESGRFCIFDMEAGPFAFYFHMENGKTEGPVPLSVYAGMHLEHRFEIGDKIEVTAVPAAAPTAFEMWYGGRVLEKEYRAIDYVNYVSLGSKENWIYDPSSSKLTTQHNVNDGQSYFLNETEEFEPTLYRVNARSEDGIEEIVTPLFPNGFVDDIGYYSELQRAPYTGELIVDHGLLKDQMDLDTGPVEISLLDHNSKSVGERITLDSNGASSSIFFNVPPGTYTIVVKSAEGITLSYDTALVYEDTLSYVRTGSPLHRIQTRSPASTQLALE